jgi:hypothetical protein
MAQATARRKPGVDIVYAGGDLSRPARSTAAQAEWGGFAPVPLGALGARLYQQLEKPGGLR